MVFLTGSVMPKQGKGTRNYYLSNIVAFSLSWILWSPFTRATMIYFQLFLLELGANTIIVGYILAVSTLILGFTRIIGGYLADYYGRKKIIVILTYGASLGYLMHALAPDWRYILLASVFMNITLLYQPAISAILADSLPKEHRGIGFASINVLPSLVSISAPYLALYVVSRYGLVFGVRLLFFLAFAMGLVVATLRLFLLKETLRIKINGNNGDVINHFKLSYKRAFSFLSANLRPLVLLYFLLNIATGIAILTQIYAVKYLGLTKEQWGWIALIGGIIYFITSLPLGYLSDKIGRKKPIIIGLILGLFSTYLYVVAPAENAFNYILAAAIIENMSWAVSSSALPALEADLIPHELRGRLSALLALVSSISFGVGQLFSGYVYELYDPRTPFTIALIIRSMTILPVLGLREKKF